MSVAVQGDGLETTALQAKLWVVAGKPTPAQFAAEVLQGLGITPSAGAVRALEAQAQAEGGFSHLNPLNTTQRMPGSTTFNSVGVQSYRTWPQAVAATVKTLNNGRYGGVLAALRTGNANRIVDAIGSSPWGTNANLLHQTLAGTPVPSAGSFSVASPSLGARSNSSAGTTISDSPAVGSGAPSDPGQGGDYSSLLGSLLGGQQRQAPPSGTLQAPSFAAAAPMPGGFRPLSAGSGPAGPSQDNLSAVLSLAQTLGGSAPGLGSPGPSVSAGGVSAPQGSSATHRSPSGPGASSYKAGGRTGSQVLELIHNDGAGKPGFGIKNGQVVNGAQTFSNVWAGHANHVHVAAGPKTVVALGQYAQSLGLHVGENPHFGGVTPVHVPGSYHYKGEAIDVSGDPAKMDAFARAVEQYNQTRHLPAVQ